MADKDREFVDIPKSLYEKIRNWAEKEGYTVSEYVIKTMREKLSEIEKEREAFTKEDEERVKERLRALGYLD